MLIPKKYKLAPLWRHIFQYIWPFHKRDLTQCPSSFSPKWYLQNNQDVADAGMDPWFHYCHHGWKEGRNPTPNFSTQFYLNEYEDVRQAAINPFVHYEVYGRRQGRRPLPTVNAHNEYQFKQNHLDECNAILRDFLRDEETLTFSRVQRPLISIILILYNRAELTFQCLKSIQNQNFEKFEIIIFDNASTDETIRFLSKVRNVKIIKSPQNIHYLRAVNKAASLAKGEYILLLNNDATIDEAALCVSDERMSDPGIGAVGGKIVLLDGSLQEAGSIIWSDGSCLGYGRGQEPASYQFQFGRDVDYCSGAFLLIRRALFEKIGRFDERYAPAYYEETDLCMELRRLNYRVVYDPRVLITHFEFASSSSQNDALQLQVRNKKKFIQKHKDRLKAQHYRNKAENILRARMRLSPNCRGRILVIDDQVPDPLKGAGFPRANHIVKVLHNEGWLVTLYPLNFPLVDYDRARNILPLEIEIVSGHGRERFEEFVRERDDYFDVIMVSRPHNMEFVRKYIFNNDPNKRKPSIIYDAEAIFAERELLADAVLGRRKLLARRGNLERELKLAEGAQCIWAVNEYEAQKFRVFGFKNVEVVGHAIEVNLTTRDFEGRQGFLFVGAMDHDSSPNVDSINWFASEAMPLLDRIIGKNYNLDLVGSAGSNVIQQLKSSRIRVHGRIEDIKTCYNSARVFIAPTRFAAGVPHKVHEAAAAGLPVVSTTLIAKQLGWRDGQEILCSETAQGFAERCAELYRNLVLWNEIREAATKAVTRDCDPIKFRRKIVDAIQSSRSPSA